MEHFFWIVFRWANVQMKFQRKLYFVKIYFPLLHGWDQKIHTYPKFALGEKKSKQPQQKSLELVKKIYCFFQLAFLPIY